MSKETKADEGCEVSPPIDTKRLIGWIKSAIVLTVIVLGSIMVFRSCSGGGSSSNAHVRDGVHFYKGGNIVSLPHAERWEIAIEKVGAQVSTWPTLLKAGEASPWIKCVGGDYDMLHECKTCASYEEQVAVARVECDPPPPTGTRCQDITPYKGKRIVALADHKFTLIIKRTN